MLGAVIRWAAALDAWLKEHVGRLYNSLLGIGLGAGIVATVKAIQQAVGSPRDVATLAATLVFEAALLINQLAQLHHFREDRRARREARKAAAAKS